MQMQTGDIVLTRCKGRMGRFIRFFTWSEYNHAALAYRCPRTNKVYLWDMGSCPSASGPIITRKGCGPSSAHLVGADQMIETQAKALVLPIEYSDTMGGAALRRDAELRVSKFIASNLGRTFASDVILKWDKGLRISSLDKSIFTDEEFVPTDGWMCAELVVETLQAAGLGVSLRPCAEFFPGLFESREWLEYDFLPTPGVSWGEPVVIA